MTDENNTIPLSWVISNIDYPKVEKLKLFFPASTWIALAELPHEHVYENFFEIIDKEKNSRHLILRGCSLSIAQKLEARGFEKVMIGKEAVIELDSNPFAKKSLHELVRRGMRHGHIEQYSYSAENSVRLSEFKTKYRHANKPQLKHLFWDEFKKDMDLFVFVDKNNKWLGGILVGQNSNKKLHTELILRNKTAPVGIMEALVYEIFNYYKERSFSELSLGEVPFIIDTQNLFLNYKSISIKIIGSFMKFAYNYEGLYNFKNKFMPRWDNIYLCAKPKLRIVDLIGIMTRSNLLKLAAYKILH